MISMINMISMISMISAKKCLASSRYSTPSLTLLLGLGSKRAGRGSSSVPINTDVLVHLAPKGVGPATMAEGGAGLPDLNTALLTLHVPVLTDRMWLPALQC